MWQSECRTFQSHTYSQTGTFSVYYNLERKENTWRMVQGTIIKITKKGDLSHCSNWRRITLLSVPSKIFYKIIIKRLQWLLMQCYRMSRLASGRAEVARNIFLPSSILLNRAQNGKGNSILTSWTSKRLLIVSTRKPLENLESIWHPRTLHRSNQAFLRGLHLQSVSLI